MKSSPRCRHVVLLALLGACAAGHPGLSLGAVVPRQDPEPVPGPTLDPDEIRERRYFRSSTTAFRVLAVPGYLLELPWYPIKWFLDFAEGTDLFTRVRDFFYLNDEHTMGWAPNLTFGGELRNGIGLSFYHHNLFDDGHEFDFSFLVGSGGAGEVQAAYTIPKSTETPYYGRIGTLFRRDDEIEIYAFRGAQAKPVLGIDTRESDETEYSGRLFNGSVDVGRTFAPGLDVIAQLNGDATRAFNARDPSLENLDGFGDEVGMIGAGLKVVVDRTDSLVRPSRGWVFEADGGASAAPSRTNSGDRFAYSRYSLDLNIFIPLFAPYRVLVLRQRFARVDPIGSAQIPFFHLLKLDRNHGLRAYDRNRFQDRGVIVTNLEYRFPIWQTWDAFLFGDAGQTFHQYSDIDTDRFRYAGGFGIRFLSEDKLLFLLQLGFGSEGSQTVFSLGTVF